MGSSSMTNGVEVEEASHVQNPVFSLGMDFERRAMAGEAALVCYRSY